MFLDLQISSDVITKATAYDRLMDENVEVKMQLRTIETEKDKYRLEMERVSCHRNVLYIGKCLHDGFFS